MTTPQDTAALDLVAKVEHMVTTGRRPFPVPTSSAPLAAHHRAEPEETNTTKPDPLLELGAAVEHFEAAWSDLRAKIRRAVDDRRGR